MQHLNVPYASHGPVDLAFDSVRWDFLDIILRNFGFGIKWRGWIQGCLSSAMGSILVNGSPTAEFKFHKGLKQGDPLSPYLFILVMESLHLSFNNIINADLFKGIRFDDSLTLFHLFYADDAVFIGKWDRANILTIVRSVSSLPPLELYLERAHILVRTNKLIDASFVASFRKTPVDGERRALTSVELVWVDIFYLLPMSDRHGVLDLLRFSVSTRLEHLLMIFFYLLLVTLLDG
ncbi:RNA-directed DNA polymerase, eukaryota [Tanacetum coccineum]